MLDGLKRPVRIGNLRAVPELIFQLISSNLLLASFLRKSVAENSYRGVSEANNRSAYLNREGPNIMTPLEMSATSIVILLSAIVTWARITARKHAPSVPERR
jgi:hypothetical protein